MSTLPLQVPLCEPHTEKTETEVLDSLYLTYVYLLHVHMYMYGVNVERYVCPLQDKFLQLLLRSPALPVNDGDLLRPLIQMLAVSSTLCGR